MGFKDSYQFLTDKDKRGSYANKTFLEFWGFEHAIGKPESYTVRRNDGYSAKFISDNEIKIEKRTYSKEVTNYHDEFHRKHKPTQKEKKLEDQFVALMKEKKEEQEKNLQILMTLAKRIKLGEKLAPDKLLQFKKANEAKDTMTKREEEIVERMKVLKETIDTYEGGCVKARSTIHPGVKLTISNAVYYVKSEVAYCRFVKSQGDVKMDSYL